MPYYWGRHGASCAYVYIIFMSNGTFRIKGMHCASCALIIEKTLKKEGGVNSVEVNYGTEAAKISYDKEKTNISKLSEKIKPFGYSFIVSEGMTATDMGMSEDEHAAHLGLNQSKNEKLAELAL